MPQNPDTGAAVCLVALGAWILLSGLDDLFVLVVFLRGLVRPSRRQPPADGQVRWIAIFVPCWREAGVIADMIDHNVSAIRYQNYHFFIGTYPNDTAMLVAAGGLESRHVRVHLALCPHDGPTTKADCLNWIYQRMLLFEEEHGLRFDVVLTHDAEDIIHPESLGEINRYSAGYAFVQTPVLPMPTPIRELTHGLYCDDFAESHTKDLVARQELGGFIPSCGVGTGYRREALESLASREDNRVFEPACLTEDYENGLRLHQAGSPQVFLPLRFSGGAPVATREYFPRTFGSAVRQRTRWVTGIVFQTWERHGWRCGWRQRYWLWRDRKSIVGHPVSLFSNVLFAYGAVTWVQALAGQGEWALGALLRQPWVMGLLGVNFVIQGIHLATRAACSASVYGGRFALGVPFRALYGNWLNTVCATLALIRYTQARLRGEPLRWVKTEHAFPSRGALREHKRPLTEILVDLSYLTEQQLADALATRPEGMALATHLVEAGYMPEQLVYEALSIQLGIDLNHIEPAEVNRNVARTLPRSVIDAWKLLPVRIEEGSLLLASPDVPPEALHSVLSQHTGMPVQIRLVTMSNYQQLARELL